MRSVITTLLVLFLFNTVPLKAGDCELPKRIKLEAKEDYAPYHTLIVDCVDWLESPPFTTEKKKRRDVQAFVIKWMMGTPTLSVKINSYHLDLWSRDSDKLMPVFLGGWARAIIQADFEIDEYEGMAGGIRTLIKVHELDGAPKKSREIKRLIKADKKGELVDYLKKKAS